MLEGPISGDQHIPAPAFQGKNYSYVDRKEKY